MSHTLSLPKSPAPHLLSLQLQFQHLPLSSPSLPLQQPSKIAPVQEDAVVAKYLENNQRKRKQPSLQPAPLTSKPSQIIGHSMAMPSTPTLESWPSIKNTPSVVKAHSGNGATPSKSAVSLKALVPLTQASRAPTQCFSSIAKTSQKAAR